MIQVTSEQQREASKIVLDAMKTMQSAMNYIKGIEMKCKCANAIAALASTLEAKPNFIFGDVNTMDEGGADDEKA